MLFRSSDRSRTKEKRGCSRMNPGDWVKVESGWLARPLQDGAARLRGGGRIHQFLWQCSHTANLRMRTVRSGAIRNRSEPGQVVRASFESGRIAVTQRVDGCYCVSARTRDSGGFLHRETARRKTPKGGTKGAREPGRTRDPGKIRENLPEGRRCEKDTADL